MFCLSRFFTRKPSKSTLEKNAKWVKWFVKTVSAVKTVLSIRCFCFSHLQWCLKLKFERVTEFLHLYGTLFGKSQWVKQNLLGWCGNMGWDKYNSSLRTKFVIFLFTENLRSQFQPYFCLADEKVDGEKDGLLTFEELDSQISQVCNFF